MTMANLMQNDRRRPDAWGHQIKAESPAWERRNRPAVGEKWGPNRERTAGQLNRMRGRCESKSGSRATTLAGGI